MILFLQGCKILIVREEGEVVLDDEDRDKINNLLAKRKSNVMMMVVHLLFPQIEEVQVMPGKEYISSANEKGWFTFKEL